MELYLPVPRMNSNICPGLGEEPLFNVVLIVHFEIKLTLRVLIHPSIRTNWKLA